MHEAVIILDISCLNVKPYRILGNLYINALYNLMPLPMLQGYIEMTTDEKVKFLLAGISKEFFGVVKCVANYIFALYTKRKEM